MLLLICFCHAVYPKLVCILITNSLGIIITDRGKIKDKLFDRAKEKKVLDHWKNIKELRDIMDRLKK